jgi:very-short-patch-repair endonuclease
MARATPQRRRPALPQTICRRRLRPRLLLRPARLAIEVDGEAHNRGTRPARDAIRDAWLVAQGIRILRYRASEVLANLDDILRQIVAIALERRATSER